MITFGGGAVLAVAMHVTTPGETHAEGWLLLLGVSGVVCVVVLAVAAQVIGWLTHARPRHRLPPGYYGAERGAG